MRILHTMLRVGDLDASIRFYTEVLGMRLLRKNDFPDGKFTLAFVGYEDESEGAAIELTHNWDTSKYDLGNGYGHIALAVDDAYAACEEVKKRGGVVTREAGPGPCTARAQIPITGCESAPHWPPTRARSPADS